MRSLGDRTSYQVRGSIENDVERLSMKKGDVPPTMLERVVNPRILKNQSLQEFHSNSDKMHRATSDDAFTTQAWFDYSRSVFPQSVRKQLQTLTFVTCQRTGVEFSSRIWIPQTRKMNSGD